MSPALRDFMRAVLLVWVCALLALLLSGCGGGDWEEDDPDYLPYMPCERKCAQ